MAHVVDQLTGVSAADEAPLILDITPPRPLGFADQFAFWANLGVTLLGFGTVLYIAQPAGYAPLPYSAATLAIVVGTVVGALILACAALPGVRTGAPSMVLLRGLFGTKVSYAPTLINI